MSDKCITDVNKFTVIRSQWSCGNGKQTKLLNEIGKYDCLGFFLFHCGFNDRQLIGIDEPVELAIKYNWVSKLIQKIGNIFYQSVICSRIIYINDRSMENNLIREDKLVELFKSINIDLTFVD